MEQLLPALLFISFFLSPCVVARFICISNDRAAIIRIELDHTLLAG